jgi:magnesium chelatase family protein
MYRRRSFDRRCLTDNAAVERYCTPSAAGLGVLERAMQHLGLAARGYHRVLKVARTIADMSGRPQIEVGHITEALALRALDRQVPPQRAPPRPDGGD